MDILGVIPARYASSRFPGKPLVDILGTPMVVHVARVTAEALGAENVIVATEDDRIARVVRDHGFSAEMTSPTALTGTDRVAAIAARIDARVYVNVQGDEPMLDSDDIVRVVDAKRAGPPGVVNAMCPLAEDDDPESVHIPKVVIDEGGRMLYMSRQRLPGHKDKSNRPSVYWKQVCIYAYSGDELARYVALGRKSRLEQCEDIEVLRFLELGIPVWMVEVSGSTYAVDSPSDVERVSRAMLKRGVA